MRQSKPGRVKRIIIAAIVATVVLCGIKAWRDTMSDPVVRHANLSLPGLAGKEAPLKLLLMSDLHVAGPDMPPSRLARIVEQANAQQPDYVLIAGDLVSDRRLATTHYSLEEAIAPLAKLRPRIGTFAVLGNHDHWRDAEVARAELAKAGIQVLNNSAMKAGPLTIGGLDDDFTGHAYPGRMLAAMRPLGPPYVVVSHSPDPFPDLPDDIGLMLAGHTHCGQLRFPLVGEPAHMSRYGDRYACGRIDERGRTLFVTAGLGVSVLPFRFGVKPDMWLVTLQGG